MEKNIRWVVKSDVNQIYEIEKQCFAHPWTEKDFLQCFESRSKICKVIEEDKIIVGFIIYELKNKKFEIYNIAVLPEYQRKGYASALVKQLLDKLKNNNRTEIDVRICETYLSGHLFFKSLGFKAVDVKREFFKEGIESFDAYVFNYSLKKINKEENTLEGIL